jgi:hypothetical protein
MIRKRNGKWCVLAKDGKLIKCFPTKKEATAMLIAIEISKAKRGK